MPPEVPGDAPGPAASAPPTTSGGPLVSLRGVDFAYGHRRALAGIDLEAGPGATAVLGPNGSGKSTLLRLIATVVTTATGTVRIAGADPRRAADRVAIRRRLGYQPQSDALPHRLRVVDHLDYVAALCEITPRRLRRRWTAWALEMVGLTDVAAERIARLSGGMRRRLLFAQALLGGPDLLVCDEPLASLDAAWRSRLTTLLTHRAAEATVVVATHHADELAAVCHRVVVLDGGKVAFRGTPAELAERAQGRAWDVTRPPPAGAAARAVGPGRWRLVAERPPPGAHPATPSVHDGYLVVTGSVDAGAAP